MTGQRRPRLSRSDWTDAALTAMATEGTAGVNVEKLARELGATKGSFYHHFANRDDLLEAALRRWEELVHDDIRTGSQIVDPRERLVALALAATGEAIDGFVDVALAASLDDPRVAASVQRVNNHRIDELTSLLLSLGIDENVARERAVGGLAAYLGLYQLQRSTGERFDDERLRALITHAVDGMLA